MVYEIVGAFTHRYTSKFDHLSVTDNAETWKRASTCEVPATASAPEPLGVRIYRARGGSSVFTRLISRCAQVCSFVLVKCVCDHI